MAGGLAGRGLERGPGGERERKRAEEWFNGAYQASGRRVQRCLQRGIASDFGWLAARRGSRQGKKIFPKDVNTNEAKSSPLGGWAEAPHGARWRRWRPYGGWRWRRDATQGRLTRLGPRTDRGGSRAGAPRSSSSIWAGVLYVGGAAARRTFRGKNGQ